MNLKLNNSVIFILGPTGVGKSEIGIELALKINGEIISADSMQVYRGMDIGTAKLSIQAQKGIGHHLIDILDIKEVFDIATFRRLAIESIGKIRALGKIPIVIGGSGLYLRALLQGIFEGPIKNEKLRAELEQLSFAELEQWLQKVDPKAASKILVNDRRRVIRALEYYQQTGKRISEQQNQWGVSKTNLLLGKTLLFGLNRSRLELYARCEQRVDRMIQSGLLEEVRQLVQHGLRDCTTASKGIGYTEMILYLEKKISWEEAIVTIKKKTRNFVKRQLTWFRKEPGIHWVELTEKETVVESAAKIQNLVELFLIKTK